MATKAGTLIKEARTGAGLTQEQLARKITGLSTVEVGKAERGEIELTQAMLKAIAKATGVTQASLLNAAKEDAAAKSKTTTKTTSKTTAAKTTTKTSTAKSTSTKAAATKTTSTKTTANTTSVKVTAAEKKLLEAYRAAGSDEKKAALKVLKGECGNMLTSLLGGGNAAADAVADFLGDALGSLLGGKK